MLEENAVELAHFGQILWQSMCVRDALSEAGLYPDPALVTAREVERARLVLHEMAETLGEGDVIALSTAALRVKNGPR